MARAVEHEWPTKTEARSSRATQARPVHGPRAILALQRSAGNSAVAGLLKATQTKVSHSPRELPVQRKASDKKKRQKTAENKVLEKTGALPSTSRPLLVVRLVAKTAGEIRGKSTTKEIVGGLTGHSWIEIDLGPDIPDLHELRNEPGGRQAYAAMEPSTKERLLEEDKTSMGFYPGENNVGIGAMIKQFFTNIKGGVEEPDHYVGEGRGIKTYVITTPEQAKGLFDFVRKNRHRGYNLLRWNCTDFAVGAIKAAGFSPPGDVRSATGMASPDLLYKSIYTRSELGDKSAKVTELKQGTSASGRSYDVGHLSEGAMKSLAKRKEAKAQKAKNKTYEPPLERKGLDESPQDVVAITRTGPRQGFCRFGPALPRGPGPMAPTSARPPPRGQRPCLHYGSGEYRGLRQGLGRGSPGPGSQHGRGRSRRQRHVGVVAAMDRVRERPAPIFAGRLTEHR
jgi:hypothetical protein